MNDWKSDDDVEAYIAATSKAVGLTVTPEQRAGVVSFVKLAADMANTLEKASLDPSESAHAPVFRLPQSK